MKTFISLLALSLLFFTPAFTIGSETTSDQLVRRVSFDIGSGKIKMVVADVDLKINKIAHVLYTEGVNVALREDLAKSLEGRLSDSIQNETVHAIAQLMAKAAPFHPTAYHGVATETLRLAKNGRALTDRIQRETGLVISIISQQEEGILGFIAAVSEAKIDPSQAVSWDFGGGSFQITTQCGADFSVYQGALGSVPMKHAVLKIQGKNILHDSPNPISEQEARYAIQLVQDSIREFPESIRQKLNQPDVVVLGLGINPLFIIHPNHLEYDVHTVYNELEARFNQDDEVLGNREVFLGKRLDQTKLATLLPNLILYYGVMDALGIHSIRYVGTLGGTAPGVLLSPKYWNN